MYSRIMVWTVPYFEITRQYLSIICEYSTLLKNSQTNKVEFQIMLPHKGIRYIEWYRDYLMTIRRQIFCSAAIVERIRKPFPPPLLPHVDLHPITEQDLTISSFHARPLVGLMITPRGVLYQKYAALQKSWRRVVIK